MLLLVSSLVINNSFCREGGGVGGGEKQERGGEAASALGPLAWPPPCLTVHVPHTQVGGNVAVAALLLQRQAWIRL